MDRLSRHGSPDRPHYPFESSTRRIIQSSSSPPPGEGKPYHLGHAVHHLNLSGKPLGLIIDLTNTDRYYPASRVSQQFGVDYVKIRCKGKDGAPDDDSINRFVKEASRFCSQNRHPARYILVHCTHGHNRTGYMIVHFLVRTQSMSVTQAINIFAEARPPGIYKAEYIAALYWSYNGRKLPDSFVCPPPTPQWKKGCNDHLNTEQMDSGSKTTMTINDLLGDVTGFEQQKELRRVCCELLELPERFQFPGSHPVSLNRESFNLLRRKYYYATWKADGTRFMMLITRQGCYLIDRRFEFRRVDMRFPCRNTKDQTHHNTLLDGEMVIDTDPRTGKQIRRYLIYDLMAINGVSFVKSPFHERWEKINKEVIEPRNRDRQALFKGIHDYEKEPFSVRRKGFWMLSTVAKLLKKFIPELSHEADGLIFQAWDDPYVPGTDRGLLKWKFPEMNSVDFLYELGADDNHGLLYLNERGRRKLMAGSRVVFKNASDAVEYSGQILECSWNPEGNSWVCMRSRPDKATPNELSTYQKVMRSIQDNITEQILLNEISESDILQLPIYAYRTQQKIILSTEERNVNKLQN